MEFPCALELQTLAHFSSAGWEKLSGQTPPTDGRWGPFPGVARRRVFLADITAPVRQMWSPLTAFPATTKCDCNRNYCKRLLLRSQGLLPNRQYMKKALSMAPTLMRTWLNYKLNQRSQSCETHICIFPWLVVATINQIKSTHLHGKFIGQFTSKPSSLLAFPPLPTARANNWNTQQTQEGSDLINSMLQLFRICGSCSKNPDDSLSFVPGSSLDNKWEQYFIYAQVINSKAEEAGDERRVISIKKVMD